MAHGRRSFPLRTVHGSIKFAMHSRSPRFKLLAKVDNPTLGQNFRGATLLMLHKYFPWKHENIVLMLDDNSSAHFEIQESILLWKWRGVLRNSSTLNAKALWLC